MVSQGRATGLDRTVEGRSNGTGETLELLGVQIGRGSFRADAGSEQRLVGVDVPDPRNRLLVEENRLDRPPARPQPATQGLSIDSSGLGTQVPQNPLIAILRAFEEMNPAEASGVDELHSEGRSAGNARDRPDEMPMRRNPTPASGIAHLDASGHSETHDQALLVIELDDQLLSAPVDASNGPADAQLPVLEPSPPSTVRVANHISPVDADPFDLSIEDRRRQLSTNRFYFREFRHRAFTAADQLEPVGGRLYSGRCRIRPRNTREVVPSSTPRSTRADPFLGITMTDSRLHQTDPAASAAEVQNAFERIRTEVRKVIVGQEEVVEEVLIAIFCGGHAIIEGVPGLAKTLLVHTLSSTLNLDFSRVQFTPDLMPSDMTGTEVIEEDKTTGQRNLRFVPGPIFANIILADEINRTPPKTQGALLEAMQERQVTAGGESHALPNPFFVLATQNPIEQEGTYPLPEAQLDRFMFNIRVGYPSEADELAIVERTTADEASSADAVLTGEDCLRIQHLVRQVPVASHVARYALRLVRSTRVRESPEDKPEIVRDYLSWGAGPRASQFLVLAAKAKALISGSSHVTPEHIKAVALPVLRHRLITNFNAEADGITTDDVVRSLLETTPVDEADADTRATLDSVSR